MALINTAVQYSEASLELIRNKRSAIDFTHLSWGDEDLQPVRREVREHYRNEQRLRCAYCLGPVSDRAAEGAPIDHIVPKSLNLHFVFEGRNLCVTCPDCNAIKNSRQVLTEYDEPVDPSVRRYPRSSRAFKIVHPHFDEYSEHIYKADKVYIDLSSKGLWTIGVCKLNRFFHRFGVSDELLGSIETIEQEERFHQGEQ